jgi:hypothetical protein
MILKRLAIFWGLTTSNYNNELILKGKKDKIE